MIIKIIYLYLHNKVNCFIEHNQVYYGEYNETNTSIHAGNAWHTANSNPNSKKLFGQTSHVYSRGFQTVPH